MQEIVVDTFVPNDAYIVGGAGNGIAVEPAEDDSEDEDSEAGGRSVSSVRSILAVGVDSAASGSDDVSSFDPAPKKLFTLPEIPISM